MKNTGVVRRIDELGRIVIPKEMRKQLMMKEGESLSFFVEDDAIVLKKFSSLKQLSPIIQVLLEGLFRKYHNTFLLCDLEKVLVCSSDGLSFQRKPILKDLAFYLKESKECIEIMEEWQGKQKVTLYPLFYEQRCVGSLIMLTKQTPYYMIDKSLIEFIKEVIEQEMISCV